MATYLGQRVTQAVTDAIGPKVRRTVESILDQVKLRAADAGDPRSRLAHQSHGRQMSP